MSRVTKDRVRRGVAEFKGRQFTTTELRERMSLPSLAVMWEMVEAGEIEFLGACKPGGGRVGTWRELRLKQVNTPPESPPPTDLLGWRAAYPSLFTDPQLPGKRSALHATHKGD